ncbi:MAG TPA: hypothetical protein VI756_10435 [Blastocatellia bacterium]
MSRSFKNFRNPLPPALIPEPPREDVDMAPIRVLTLPAPKATALLVGMTRRLTLGWGDFYNEQWIAIHSAEGIAPEEAKWFEENRELFRPYGFVQLFDFTRGAVLCLVQLSRVWQIRARIHNEDAFGPYEFGRWIWDFSGCRRFSEPYRLRKSRFGLWHGYLPRDLLRGAGDVEP